MRRPSITECDSRDVPIDVRVGTEWEGQSLSQVPVSSLPPSVPLWQLRQRDEHYKYSGRTENRVTRCQSTVSGPLGDDDGDDGLLQPPHHPLRPGPGHRPRGLSSLLREQGREDSSGRHQCHYWIVDSSVDPGNVFVSCGYSTINPGFDLNYITILTLTQIESKSLIWLPTL